MCLTRITCSGVTIDFSFIPSSISVLGLTTPLIIGAGNDKGSDYTSGTHKSSQRKQWHTWVVHMIACTNSIHDARFYVSECWNIHNGFLVKKRNPSTCHFHPPSMLTTYFPCVKVKVNKTSL
jgi:hypothetical protein